MIYPRVFGFAREQDWRMGNVTVKLVDDHDENTYQPFHITAFGPCRVWWEWRKTGANKSTRHSKKVLDF